MIRILENRCYGRRGGCKQIALSEVLGYAALSLTALVLWYIYFTPCL